MDFFLHVLAFSLQVPEGQVCVKQYVINPKTRIIIDNFIFFFK